ncbi:beta-defensin 104A-like [Trichechus manatus latirostris]|uniref:Beta-defensin 104A-like n=1 Tax=Trichechus manatus latirostris TaxID=127582 RepID=A0A2Y9RDQ3_TRIMA|nr:beta-defensin 104A-like [Trichechus manatus latirostris]
MCGYGTPHCWKTRKKEENRIGKGPNIYLCCLKKWDSHLLNPSVKY